MELYLAAGSGDGWLGVCMLFSSCLKIKGSCTLMDHIPLAVTSQSGKRSHNLILGFCKQNKTLSNQDNIWKTHIEWEGWLFERLPNFWVMEALWTLWSCNLSSPLLIINVKYCRPDISKDMHKPMWEPGSPFTKGVKTNAMFIYTKKTCMFLLSGVSVILFFDGSVVNDVKRQGSVHRLIIFHH